MDLQRGYRHLHIEYVSSPSLSSRANLAIDRQRRRIEAETNEFNGPILMAHSLQDDYVEVYPTDYAHCRQLWESGDPELGLGPLWAGVIIYNPQGQVLLARRSEDMTRSPGQWNLPSGGSLLGNETPADGMRREIAEELGSGALDAIQDLQYLGYSLSRLPQGLGLVWHGLLTDQDALVPAREEISALEWHDPYNLPANTKQDTRDLIGMWLDRLDFCGINRA